MIRVSVEPGAALGLPESRLGVIRLMERLMPVVGLAEASVELEIVGDATIAELNERFLGCLGPTNILSFPSGEPDSGAGQLVLSGDAVLREVDLYGQEPLAHLARLLAHGLLHLAGHDHGELMDLLTDMAVDAATQDAAPGVS